MVRVALKLVIIFILVTAGVYFGYGRLEKKLLSDIQEPDKTVAGKKAAAAAGTAQPQKAVGSKAVDYQIIVQRNIFQASLHSTKVVVKEVVEEVVPTTLNLTLLGTVTGSDRDARAIIIDNKAKQQDIFQIGDAIQGAFVDSIERGKITLDVNGKKEALLIKDREGGGPGPPPVPKSAAQRSPAKTVEKNGKRTVPRVRPNRRISFRQDSSHPAVRPNRGVSFRQDSDQSAANPEEPETMPGVGDKAEPDAGEELPGIDELPRE